MSQANQTTVDYRTIPGLQFLFEQIAPGSNEGPVQEFMENLLQWEFPIGDGWIHGTKARHGSNEPDDKVRSVRRYQDGLLVLDALTGELKRLREKPKDKHFNKVVEDQLDRYLRASNNPHGSTLHGFVTIGHHIKFYKIELPDGAVMPQHEGFWHLWDDATTVKFWFDWIKDKATQFANDQALG